MAAAYAARAAGVVGSKSGLMRGGGPAGRPTAGRATGGPRTSSRRRPSRSPGRARGSACAARSRRGAGRCTRGCRASLHLEVARRPGTSSARRSTILSLKTSCRSLGRIVTSSVNATGHHSWKRQHLALVLALARAVLAAAEHQHHRVVALQLGEPVHRRRSRRAARSRGDVARASGPCSSVRLLRTLSAQPVDARQRGDVEGAAVVVAPREVVRRLGQLAACRGARRSGESTQMPPGPQT